MAAPHDANTRMLKILGAVVAAMVLLSFAAVPFYSWFAHATGFGGTVQSAATGLGPDKVLDRAVAVRFDASRTSGMAWQVATPEPATMQLKIGATGKAVFEAYNPTDAALAGQASISVTPPLAGGYFTKIACFCDGMQVLKPHQRVQMPVSFYVDPKMVRDPEATYIHEITLSFTFHSKPLPRDWQLAGTAGPGVTVN